MHVLFLYSQQNTVLFQKPLRGQEEISFGISYIAAVLEQESHTCELIVLNSKNRIKNERLLSKVIQSTQPDLICFTSVFSEYNYIRNIAGFIKKTFPNIFLLLGGVHISLKPNDDALETFDALCIGEGENATLELVNCLIEKKPVSKIQNLWIRTTEGIEKNSTQPYIANLDQLPFPNRRMWQPWILNTQTRLTVLLGRGCPFNCSYCSNHKLRKISKGEYVRLRSPKNIVEEIDLLSQQFPNVFEYVLEVETLGVDINWLRELCEELCVFNKNRGKALSFSSNLRVHPQMDFDTIFKSLKKANFKSIVIGLESGSELVRRNVLNRNYSNHDILVAVQKAGENNIGIGIFNLIGLPDETEEDYKETLKLNQQIQPDWHATSIFFPYPGTDLYDRVKAMGLMLANLPGKDERQIARISYPDFSRKQIQKAFDRFHYEVYRHNPHKKTLKSFVYLIQSFMGHNLLAKTKLRLIKALYLLHLQGMAKRVGLFKIFQ